MKDGYTADELFEIAEDIEREGEVFYKRAAKHTRKVASRKLYLDLAADEKQHRQLFRQMRKKMATQDESSLLRKPDRTISLYLRLVAKGSVFQAPRARKGGVTLPEAETDIVRLAVQKELESLLYYCGMQGLLVDDEARAVLDAIMKEEREHIAALAIHHKLA